jgi:hypothetical protein
MSYWQVVWSVKFSRRDSWIFYQYDYLKLATLTSGHRKYVILEMREIISPLLPCTNSKYLEVNVVDLNTKSRQVTGVQYSIPM